MHPEISSLDSRLEATGADIDRQLKRLSKPDSFSPSTPARPLYYVRLFVGLMVLGAGGGLISAVGSLFVHRPELVVVSMGGGKAQVWRTISEYETATGKRGIEQPAGAVQFADYEATTFEDRLGEVVKNLIWLLLLVAALRSINTAAKQLQSGQLSCSS
jgi:hypothetical protein